MIGCRLHVTTETVIDGEGEETDSSESMTIGLRAREAQADSEVWKLAAAVRCLADSEF
jgi:hypothetical protein